MKQEKGKATTLYIDREIYDKAKKLGEKDRRSVSNLVTVLLEKYIEEKESK